MARKTSSKPTSNSAPKTSSKPVGIWLGFMVTWLLLIALGGLVYYVTQLQPSAQASKPDLPAAFTSMPSDIASLSKQMEALESKLRKPAVHSEYDIAAIQEAYKRLQQQHRGLVVLLQAKQDWQQGKGFSQAMPILRPLAERAPDLKPYIETLSNEAENPVTRQSLVMSYNKLTSDRKHTSEALGEDWMQKFISIEKQNGDEAYASGLTQQVLYLLKQGQAEAIHTLMQNNPEFFSGEAWQSWKENLKQYQQTKQAFQALLADYIQRSGATL